MMHLVYSVSFALLLTVLPLHAADAKPLNVLHILGAQGHDIAAQKDIIKKGFEERISVVIDHLYTAGDLTGKPGNPKLPILGNPEYAKGYDLVIHEVMTPGLYDRDIVKAVLKPHLVDKIPAVVLHTGASAYRAG